MSPAMTIEVLPAERGDCLWIECHGSGRPWRLLVDGGLPSSWAMLRRRIERLSVDDRRIDLLVVTHIDADHIGGALPLLRAKDLGLTVGEVWFNGFDQLPDELAVRRSVAQGESLVGILTGEDAVGAPPPPWNQWFGRTAVMTGGDGEVVVVQRAGWPALTLLSPTPKRLRRLRSVWLKELARVRRGEPADEPQLAWARTPLDDLQTLAERATPPDQSAANCSSIAFLLEHRGASCLLTGDAFSNVLGAALTTLANQRGGPVPVDVFKLPHHGSQGNVTAKLLALAPAHHYVVSTNGDRFDHPDDVALARVVTSGPPGLTLCFNYSTDAASRWAEPALIDRYGYHTRLPADGDDGVCIELAGRP